MKSSLSWNTKNFPQKPSEYLDLYESKNGKVEYSNANDSNLNTSTLSLHIAEYENLNVSSDFEKPEEEDLIKEFKSVLSYFC